MLNLCPKTTIALTKRPARPQRKTTVIFITQMNGSKIYINPELIQSVEATPDTIITLVSNKKLIAKEPPQEIAERFIEYRRKTLAPSFPDKPANIRKNLSFQDA
jgi:flagellar protein FlbD